jgi:hypothetical protein
METKPSYSIRAGGAIAGPRPRECALAPWPRCKVKPAAVSSAQEQAEDGQ